MGMEEVTMGVVVTGTVVAITTGTVVAGTEVWIELVIIGAEVMMGAEVASVCVCPAASALVSVLEDTVMLEVVSVLELEVSVLLEEVWDVSVLEEVWVVTVMGTAPATQVVSLALHSWRPELVVAHL